MNLKIFTTKSLLSLMIPLGILSCSDAPQQPHNSDHGPNVFKTLPSQPNDPSATEFIAGILPNELSSGSEGDGDIDARVKFNSEQPILYGVGAAGITLEMTLEESKKILTPPLRGPDSEGNARYNEQLFIRWRETGKRTPYYIVVLPGYKGALKMNAPLGDVHIPHEFSSYLAIGGRKGADKLALDMYTSLTGSTDDCLSQNVCEIIWGDETQNDFLITFPGLGMRISKDRFSMYLVFVEKNIPQGPLANDFDMFSGEIRVADQDPISLGQSFEDIDPRMIAADKSLANVEITTNTKSFGRNYSGVFLSYQKTDYSRQSIRPKSTDKLAGIQLYGRYKKQFLANDKPVQVVQKSLGDVEVRLAEEAPEEPSSENELITPLQINLSLAKENVLPFTKVLVSFLMEQATEAYPNAKVMGQIRGEHQDKDVKEYDGTVVVYNETDQTGTYLSFRANEGSGNMDSMLAFSLDSFSPLDKIIIPESFPDRPIVKDTIETTVINPISQKSLLIPVKGKMGAEVKTESGTLVKETKKTSASRDYFTRLSGFNLGDIVLIDKQDILGRQEADITYTLPSMIYGGHSKSQNYVGLTDRVEVDEFAELSLPGENDKIIARSQITASVGLFGVNLGLQKVAPSPKGGYYAQVISISSGLLEGLITGLCNLETFQPKLGMKDTEVLKSLQQAVLNEQSENGKSDCHFFSQTSDTGTNELVQIIFPKDKLKLVFSDHTLGAVTIWQAKATEASLAQQAEILQTLSHPSQGGAQ